MVRGNYRLRPCINLQETLQYQIPSPLRCYVHDTPIPVPNLIISVSRFEGCFTHSKKRTRFLQRKEILRIFDVYFFTKIRIFAKAGVQDACEMKYNSLATYCTSLILKVGGGGLDVTNYFVSFLIMHFLCF